MGKTSLKKFTSLRMVDSSINLSDLSKITELFDHPTKEYILDDTYEADSPNPNLKNVEKFAILQKYNRVNLVIQVGAEYMYYVAMQNKSCKLTALGTHYWNLVK